MVSLTINEPPFVGEYEFGSLFPVAPKGLSQIQVIHPHFDGSKLKAAKTGG